MKGIGGMTKDKEKSLMKIGGKQNGRTLGVLHPWMGQYRGHSSTHSSTWPASKKMCRKAEKGFRVSNSDMLARTRY